MARLQLGPILQQLYRLTGPDPRNEPTDGQLVERFVISREEAAFELLVRRHGGLVLRVCRRVLDDPHAADDAFQATFLVLVRKAGTIRRHESLTSWLYAVAYRVARKVRTQAGKRQTQPLPDVPCEEADPAGAPHELRRVLDEELVRLGEKHRAPLVLCYLEGKTYTEAARELGWSEGSMSRRLAQARERLRQRLVRRGIALSVAALSTALTAEAVEVPAELVRQTWQTTSQAPVALATLVDGVVREMMPIKIKVLAGACLLVTTMLVGFGLVGLGEPQAGFPVVDAPLPEDLPPLPDVVAARQAELDPPYVARSEFALGRVRITTYCEDPPATRWNGGWPDMDAFLDLPSPARIAIKRRNRLGENELRAQLLRVPELSLDGDKTGQTSRAISERSRQPDWKLEQHETLAMLSGRADLRGLVLLDADNCQLDTDRAGALGKRSLELRRLLGEAQEATSDPLTLAGTLRLNLNRGEPSFREMFRQPAAVPALVQTLTGEHEAVRLVLVEQLKKIDHSSATAALAQIAIFDLSPRVRADAIAALAERPTGDYRPVLLEGFRYPWPAAADHAAEALVALHDRGAIPALRNLASQPDPTAPVYDENKQTWTAAQLVRVNHHRNCLLCHAPSPDGWGFAVAPVPVPGKPLPPLQFYDLAHSPQGMWANLVRADVTYLRQDFSALLPVEKADPWPAQQRFDYVIRRQPVSPPAPPRSPSSYPQREAVLFALRELEAP